LKGKLSFVKELADGLLPTHSEQEIRDHEAWYQEYLQLNDKKKEVIQKWREKKEVALAAAECPTSTSLSLPAVGSDDQLHP